MASKPIIQHQQIKSVFREIGIRPEFSDTSYNIGRKALRKKSDKVMSISKSGTHCKYLEKLEKTG